jgi:hypothetical protein
MNGTSQTTFFQVTSVEMTFVLSTQACAWNLIMYINVRTKSNLGCFASNHD